MNTEPPGPRHGLTTSGAGHRRSVIGSGLFPTGPARPVFREPHRVRVGGVLLGFAGGAGWLALFALLGSGLASRVWLTVAAGTVAWLAAGMLARHGDRGVAVGVAGAVSCAWVAAGGAVALYWSVTSRWPLW